MDDVKDKMKGIFKKVNKTLSSSSGKFQGQGRVLGSGSDANEQPIVSPLVQRFSAPTNSRPNPPKASKPDGERSSGQFSPWEPYISSGKRSVNDSAPEVLESSVNYADADEIEAIDRISGRVGEFVSSEPPKESVDVVLKIMRNVAREPENDKFRRIRMGNPKIKQTVSDISGAVELLQSVGFRIQDEDGETWGKMDLPEEKQIRLIKEAVNLLEKWTTADSIPTSSPSSSEKSPPKEKIDRQVKVFFSIPESAASKIELPDGFYNLSAAEIRREAESRRKKIEESQILIPKSFKEKQMKATQKKYRATCIRVQFPDGVVLQGIFLPHEATTALYEFVSSALKQPELEFELMRPAFPKMRLIPMLSGLSGRPPTLEEEELVPSALIKFLPRETDSIVFTGLANHLLEISEPLIS